MGVLERWLVNVKCGGVGGGGGGGGAGGVCRRGGKVCVFW